MIQFLDIEPVKFDNPKKTGSSSFYQFNNTVATYNARPTLYNISFLPICYLYILVGPTRDGVFKSCACDFICGCVEVWSRTWEKPYGDTQMIGNFTALSIVLSFAGTPSKTDGRGWAPSHRWKVHPTDGFCLLLAHKHKSLLPRSMYHVKIPRGHGGMVLSACILSAGILFTPFIIISSMDL